MTKDIDIYKTIFQAPGQSIDEPIQVTKFIIDTEKFAQISRIRGSKYMKEDIIQGIRDTLDRISLDMGLT